MLANSARLALRERVRTEVPEGPGVYTWLAESGEPLYVGKSRNLRRRMLSYLVPGQTEHRSRMRRLAFALHGFRYRQTEGELLAILLEDALIKELQPRHNERSRDFRERRFLQLTAQLGLAFLAVAEAGASGEHLYGPFKDRYFVADLVELLKDVFGLAPGAGRRPGASTAGLRCGLDDDERIGHVRAFLGGDVELAEVRLAASLDRACERLEFERAALLRDRLAFCRRFAARQRFIAQFRDGGMQVDEQGSGLRHRFDRGAVTEVLRGETSLDVPAELRGPVCDARFLVDRANAVYAWLQARRPPAT
jgi:excinuclease ABC subunit C